MRDKKQNPHRFIQESTSRYGFLLCDYLCVCNFSNSSFHAFLLNVVECFCNCVFETCIFCEVFFPEVDVRKNSFCFFSSVVCLLVESCKELKNREAVVVEVCFAVKTCALESRSAFLVLCDFLTVVESDKSSH